MKQFSNLKRAFLPCLFVLLTLPAWGQMQPVTKNFRKTPLKNVLKEVEAQTGLSIMYDTRELNLERPVTASFDRTPVSQVLREVLDRTVQYSIKDKMIVIYKASATPPPAAGTGKTLTGTVLDETGAPMVGAAVATPDGRRGTVTDSNGRYSLTLGAGDALISVSYLGYVTRQIVIGDRTEVDVNLVPDAKNTINEVVVIGYGAVKKSDLTGSVSNVKMSDIRDVPNTSVDQALQGRIAGVDIMSTSGAPGATTSIRVRGTRSISASNEPLIVVDGVIDAVSDLNDINSADIEQISVLKDASSTAIYGSRGANGVIIVTTRQGVTSKPSVTAKAEFGVSKLARDLDLMDAQEFVRYLNDRNYFSSRDPQRPPRFDPSEYGRGTDWIDEITRTALYQNYNLSVSGRSQKSSYFAALGGNDTQGIVDGSGFRRITARLNLSYDFAKWLTVGFKGSYTFRDENPNRATIGGANIWDGAVYLAPTMGPKDYINPLYENGVRIDTPRAKIDCNENESERMTNTDVLEFTIKPVRGLIIKSQNSYMVYQRHDYQFWPSYLPKRTEGEGADAYRYEGDARRLTSENTVSYSKKFASGHYFDAMAGFSATHETANFFSLKAEGLLTDDLKWNNMNSIGSKENYNASTSSNKVVRESVLMRLNYNYKSRYYFTFTGRYDGSSNFAENNKWGFFPSAAVKWNAKNENFLKQVRWLDELSLRLSAGRTGNDAIGNPCNANLSFAGGTQAQKAKDGAANLLYDGDNDAIYMLVNMNCGWRRTGRSVPQGVGTVSGIVVHTPMERWGGNVGRYSIRPFDEADIDIPRAAASAYATLVEWRLDKAVISVGAYKWNDNGTYTVGSAANSATQLVQNRMHATTDNTGGGARLYSENRMLNQTVTADRSYPIAIVHGYRGLNVSNYVPGDGTTMGMSKYTMLGFLGNVAGWYEWNGDTWTGKTNGIVMEFSTAGVGGSAAAVSFSTAAGKHSTNEAACSWTNASSYPVYWKVEYATSADGATWSDYTETVNAATGERGFEMRSLPWCINNSSTRTSVFDTANRSGVYTQSDFGFGLVPYRFVLPVEVLGKAKVRVRISPSSDVIATWNPGIDGYALGQTHRNLRIARTYPFDIANGVYVEDLSIQYK